jgi:hypothetical protein
MVILPTTILSITDAMIYITPHTCMDTRANQIHHKHVIIASSFRILYHYIIMHIHIISTSFYFFFSGFIFTRMLLVDPVCDADAETDVDAADAAAVDDDDDDDATAPPAANESTGSVLKLTLRPPFRYST